MRIDTKSHYLFVCDNKDDSLWIFSILLDDVKYVQTVIIITYLLSSLCSDF